MINAFALNSSLPICPGILSEIASLWTSLQCLAFLLILVVSVVGNLIVLKTIVLDQEMRNAYCNIFISNLSLCDTIQASIILPPMAGILIFDKRWFLTFDILPDLPCQLGKSLNKLVPAVTSLTNVIIAIDRLIGIVRPFRVRIPRHYAAIIIVATWLSCGVFAFFDFIHSQVLVFPDNEKNCLMHYCYSDAEPDDLTRSTEMSDLGINYFRIEEVKFVSGKGNYFDSKEIGNIGTDHILTIDLIIYCIAIFLIPLTLISIAYGFTGYELWFKGAAGLGESCSRRQIDLKRKAVKMMVLVVLVFALTRMPLFVVYLVAIWMGSDLPFQEKLTLAVSWVYCTSTVFNPLIYASMNEKFRDEFKATILCRKIERPSRSRRRPFQRNAPNQSSQLLRTNNFTRTCTSNLENGLTDNGVTLTTKLGGAHTLSTGHNPLVKKTSHVPANAPASANEGTENRCGDFLEQRYPSIDCDDVTFEGEAYEMQTVFTNNLNSCS